MKKGNFEEGRGVQRGGGMESLSSQTLGCDGEQLPVEE